MKIVSLHEKFVTNLYDKIPRKDIVNKISEMLRIEKDAAYRRLNGKVNFSINEMGIISDRLDISLDGLMFRSNEIIWLPFMLEQPLKMQSMDEVLDVIDNCLERIYSIDPQTGEFGNIYHTLPMEFYFYSPVLIKFMFFKWGHYFLGKDEYNSYSEWKLPQRINDLLEKLKVAYHFNKVYYIWDNSLIALFAKEIHNFYRMHIITNEEKNEIKDALKEMLTRIEQSLNGTYIPTLRVLQDASFYTCSMHIGFTSNYFMSESIRSINFQTNFSFCTIEGDNDKFQMLKNWIDSFKGISTLLSRSGRVERRLFFEEQHNIIDYILY